LSVSQIVLSAGVRIPVNENNIPFEQLTLDFRYVNLCRTTTTVTVPAFRRLHCPKEHRRWGRPGGYQSGEPFQLRPHGFDWNSRWECTTLSVIHLAGKTPGSGVGTTTTVPCGGPGWKAQGYSTSAGRAPKGPRRWMVSRDSLRVQTGCAMLAISPAHYLFAVCHTWICGRNFHSGGRQEYRILQNRE